MSNYQKNSKDYGEPDITYQLAGSAEQRQPRRHDTVSVHSRGDRHLGYSSRHFRKLNWKYELEYGSTRLRIGDGDASMLQGFEHSFSFYYSPAKKLSLSLNGEYYHNEIARHQSP